VPQLAALIVFGYVVAWFLLPEIPPELEPEIAPVVRGLYRPANGRALAGVCLGVARYYKLDVRLVRLVTLVLAMAGGVGIIAYVGAWLLMPSAMNQNEV
jgi:phage shock protein PspC (stress-responsive transcriptional regulator)